MQQSEALAQALVYRGKRGFAAAAMAALAGSGMANPYERPPDIHRDNHVLRPDDGRASQLREWMDKNAHPAVPFEDLQRIDRRFSTLSPDEQQQMLDMLNKIPAIKEHLRNLGDVALRTAISFAQALTFIFLAVWLNKRRQNLYKVDEVATVFLHKAYNKLGVTEMPHAAAATASWLSALVQSRPDIVRRVLQQQQQRVPIGNLVHSTAESLESER
jgi:hypothetical protein